MYLQSEQQQTTINIYIAVVSSNYSTLKLHPVIYFSTYSNCNSFSSSHSVMWKVICTESIPAWPLFYSIISKVTVPVTVFSKGSYGSPKPAAIQAEYSTNKLLLVLL